MVRYEKSQGNTLEGVQRGQDLLQRHALTLDGGIVALRHTKIS